MDVLLISASPHWDKISTFFIGQVFITEVAGVRGIG